MGDGVGPFRAGGREGSPDGRDATAKKEGRKEEGRNWRSGILAVDGDGRGGMSDEPPPEPGSRHTTNQASEQASEREGKRRRCNTSCKVPTVHSLHARDSARRQRYLQRVEMHNARRSTRVVHTQCPPKYSAPTRRLNQNQKRLPREKRKGWLLRLRDFRRDKVADRKSPPNPTHHQARCHRSISVAVSRSPSPPTPAPFPVIKAIRIGQESGDSKSFDIAMQDWVLSDPRKFAFCFKKNRTEHAALLSVYTRIPDALLRPMQHILW